MNKNEKQTFENVFLTCPECGDEMHITGDHLNEEGNLVLHTSCITCEANYEHTVSMTEV